MVMRKQVLHLLILGWTFFSNPLWAGLSATPAYPKIDINIRQTYDVAQFPYQQYFVCLKAYAPELSTYIAHDPLFQKTVRTASAEMAATFYRFLDGAAEKDNFRQPPVNTLRPPREPVPFATDAYFKHFPYSYISKAKRQYHYDITPFKIRKEMWRRTNQERYWIFNKLTFYKRTSDYNVEKVTGFNDLMILSSIDMRALRKTGSESAAYQFAYNNAELYYFSADVKDCR